MNSNIIEGTKALHDEMKEWMNHMHQHPELALEEKEPARFIADKVRSFGYEVTEGIGKTGIVATLTQGEGKKAIGLRADFDALPIQEVNELPYKSKVEGKSHLCGHDGHTAMLLGAAAAGWIQAAGGFFGSGALLLVGTSKSILVFLICFLV